MSARTRVFSASVALLVAAASHSGLGARQRIERPSARPGQTATQLADGRWLIVGRDGDNVDSRILDAESGTVVQLAGPHATRLWHTATLLPDGSVLILGGINERGQTLAAPEVFDPATGQFSVLDGAVAARRARHTATLLTDGRVLLVAGDVEAGGATAEVWDPSSRNGYPVPPPAANRRNHRAQLLADGRVLVEGGVDPRGRAVDAREIFEPGGDVFWPSAAADVESRTATLTGSYPVDGGVNVSPNVRIVLRFGEPIDVRSLRDATVAVDTSGTHVQSRVIPAEGGRLIFVTPSAPFEAGAAVRLTAEGLRTRSGAAIAPARFGFTIASLELPAEAPHLYDPEVWVPRNSNWRSERGESQWKRLAPLQAAKGVTAVAGQVLRLDGRPLADVTLEIKGEAVRSDRTGRFLLVLNGVEGGWHELTIEGKTANHAAQRFGRFEYGLTIVKGRTNMLPFTIWMPVLDTTNAVRIESPTRAETVITTPYIPGLELHLPAGTTITDEKGKTVREISITPIPVDRTPFPLPNGVQVPVYFTIQPGGAYVHVPNQGTYRRGAWLVYPNYIARPVGERLPFWFYDPEEDGWHVYGFGKVAADGRQVMPERGTYLYEFTGAMMGVDRDPAADPPADGDDDGDPVDLATGLFIMENVDLYLPDVIPLVLKRTYRTNDDGVRAFGVGTQHPYDMWFDNQVGFQEVDLILPDATRIHYVRTSAGTGLSGAVFEHTTTPSAFYGSTVTYTGSGWDLRTKDGTVFVFDLEAPLQSIRDRFGNTVTITRTGGNLGNIAKITSPNGRYIEFTYDTSNRITQATDNAGRSVTYTYNAAGSLSTVTDVNGGVTEYTYDGAHRLLMAEDPRNIVYLDNEYDTAGRVVRQTQANGGEYQFDYTLNGSGQVTRTDITNPRGFVRRVAFNAARYVTWDTIALGQSEEQTRTYTRISGSQMLDTVTDELGRVTKFQYDSKQNATSMTRLFGTSDASTTTFTYDSTYNLLTSHTDPLNHTTSIAYDTQGNLQSVTTPLSHQWTFGANNAGQIGSMTTPLSKTKTVGYESGDAVSVTTALGHTTNSFVDGAGRAVRITDARGAVTRFEYNAVNQVTKAIDPLGGETTFTYDANGNLLTLTDARAKTTTWTYDNMDRVATRTDPLNRQESFTYDVNSNLTSWTDRKGQVTSYTYDALDRQTFIGFGTSGNPATYSNTITTTYDNGNRVTQVVDSAAGTITRGYDLLDRLTQEVTPEGTVNYTYDAADRRATMSVAGQSAVSYTYDNADRLTAVTQGTATVSIGYDSADRRTSLTLANGVIVEYVYDDDSHIAGLTYKKSGSTIGTLAYTYDANGSRTAVEGTYARSNLPASLTSATYDNANQIATWGGASFAYDANGNVTSDLARGYTWNARNELVGITGTVSASFEYDAFGRRRSKTVSGTTTQFLYDGASLVQELASGSPTANILAGLATDEHFRRTDVITTHHYLSDALGSAIALTDAAGSVQTEYTYDPFGAATTSGASSSNTFGFTAREVDGTGLSFYRARYYDPITQRFTSEDPISFLGGDVNVYAYVGNDPQDWVDPLGLTQGCPANTAARARIDEIARSYDGSQDWNFDKPKGEFPANSNKCNKFVCDVLRAAGTPLLARPGGRYPCATAGELADPKWNPDNWRQLSPNETPLPGDVAAYPLFPPTPGASGHSGIIIRGGLGNMSAHANGVYGKRGQFTWGIPGIVFRRYTGGC